MTGPADAAVRRGFGRVSWFILPFGVLLPAGTLLVELLSGACAEALFDPIPTAVHVSAAMEIHQQLLPALKHLSGALEKKADEVGDVVKTGRTHLMDAMPVTLGQELDGWRSQIDHASERLGDTLKPVGLQPQRQPTFGGIRARGCGKR